MHFPIKSVPLAASCALASLALAACGGSGSNASASSSQDNEQKIVNFARCMREHGVNTSTPNGPGGPLRINGTSPQVMEAAQKACERFRPQGGKEKLSPADRAAREDALRKFARCMRSHGIELQTETRNGGAAIGIHLNRSGVNPESPAFQTAQKACESYLPKFPGRGRGSGSGAPSTGSSSGPASGSAGPSLSLQTGK